MKDKQGREYARLSQIRLGTIVTVDENFAWFAPWSQHEVLYDERGRSYIASSCGKHYLNTLLREDGSIIGVYLHG